MKLKNILAVSLINILSLTWRYHIIGKIPTKPAIIVFWHGLMLPVWKFFSKNKPYAVVSLSKDGQLLSDLLIKWHYSLIRGSSSKEGKKVLEELSEVAKSNYVLVTPDGPRGPLGKFKVGAIVASHRSTTPIYLVAIKIHLGKTFVKSWDKFRLPLPFSKITISISQAELIPQNASREEIENKVAELETKLIKMQEALLINSN